MNYRKSGSYSEQAGLELVPGEQPAQRDNTCTGKSSCWHYQSVSNFTQRNRVEHEDTHDPTVGHEEDVDCEVVVYGENGFAYSALQELVAIGTIEVGYKSCEFGLKVVKVALLRLLFV
jgi:hypothetical protein